MRKILSVMILFALLPGMPERILAQSLPENPQSGISAATAPDLKAASEKFSNPLASASATLSLKALIMEALDRNPGLRPHSQKSKLPKRKLGRKNGIYRIL